jgi:hypothetical protein
MSMSGEYHPEVDDGQVAQRFLDRTGDHCRVVRVAQGGAAAACRVVAGVVKLAGEQVFQIVAPA